MAVLNPPSSLPGLARSLTNHLLEVEGQCDEVRLVALFAPPGLAGEGAGSRGVENTLIVGRAIGLFDRVGDGQVALGEAVVNRPSDGSYSKSAFRRLLRDLVLNPERDGDPWDNEAGTRTSGARDIARALAWFLAQDACGPPFAWAADDSRFSIQDLQSLQLRVVPKDDRPFQNDTRWGAFTRWAPILGLAEEAYLPSIGIGLVPLPVVAIREALEEVQSGEHPIAAILQHIRRRLPVVHGAAFRTSMDTFLSEDPDACVQRHGLDSSIAQSLMLLQDRGMLRMERRADAEREVILDDEDVYVSHVTLGAEAAA